MQTRLFPQKSRKNPEFRQISAIFVIFPGKKSVPAIERASRGSVSHVKSVSPRKERLGTLPEFSRINYFPQETTRRSLGRSLRKTRYIAHGLGNFPEKKCDTPFLLKFLETNVTRPQKACGRHICIRTYVVYGRNVSKKIILTRQKRVCMRV